MTKTEKIKIWIFYLLFIGFVAYIAYWSFCMGRDSYSPWGEAIWFGYFGIGVVLYVLARIALGFRIEKQPENSLKSYVVKLFNIVFLFFIAAKMLGDFLWREEFQRNREVAETIISKVEKHHHKEGKYPEQLTELIPASERVITTSAFVDTVYFKHKPTDAFIVYYNYGWYSYSYHSEYKKWFSSD